MSEALWHALGAMLARVALDADVGWLWHVTEEGGEYAAYYGEEGQRAQAQSVARRFDFVGEALGAAGLPRHREPRYPDPIALMPERVRMGFYSSGKYDGLESIVAFVRGRGRAPRRRDELGGVAPDTPAEAPFEHLHACGVSPASVYVPLDFPRAIACHAPEEVQLRTIGSSPALVRECVFLLNLYDGFAETHRDYDWDMSPPAGAWTRVVEPHDFEEEIDLARRLLQVARRSIRMGASITFC